MQSYGIIHEITCPGSSFQGRISVRVAPDKLESDLESLDLRAFSTPTKTDHYLCLVPATVFIVIVLLICAIKNHFCGILQPVLDLAVAAFPSKIS